MFLERVAKAVGGGFAGAAWSGVGALMPAVGGCGFATEGMDAEITIEARVVSVETAASICCAGAALPARRPDFEVLLPVDGLFTRKSCTDMILLLLRPPAVPSLDDLRSSLLPLIVCLRNVDVSGSGAVSTVSSWESIDRTGGLGLGEGGREGVRRSEKSAL